MLGLPDEDEPEMEWHDKLIELNRRHEEFEREREARKQAEQQAATAQLTTPDLIRRTMAETHPTSKSTIPLNGAAVLRAALAGGPGTINGA